MPLISQIVEFSTSIGALVVVNSKIDEMDHRSSEAMLLKCEAHFAVMSEGDLTLGRGRLCVFSKPRSEGQAILADFDDERYVVHTNCAFSARSSGARAIGAEHDNHAIKIRVPLTNDVWVAILNEEAVTMTVSAILRLFWLLI